MSELLATYLLTEPGADTEKKAEQIATGLTVGSWTDLPLVKQEQMQKHKGRVIKLRRERELLHQKNKRSSQLPILKSISLRIFRLC